MNCPYRKNCLFWHYFLIFSCCVLRKWIKTKGSCSSKQNWEHVFFRKMLRNKIPKVVSIFVPRNGILSCFLFWGMVQNGFREFVSIFVPGHGIPSISLFCGRVWIGIQRVFCSVEKTICFVYSGIIFCRKFPILSQTDQFILWVKLL